MALDVKDVTFDELEDDIDDGPEDLDTDQPDQNQEEQPSNEADEIDEPDGFDNLESDLEEEIEDSGSANEEAENDVQDEEDELTEEDVQDEPENEETQEEGEETDEETRFVDDLASQFGLDPEEDFEEDVEDTWDGALKVARRGGQKLAQNEVSSFFEEYPDVAQYADYRAKGGDPDKYQQEVLNAPSYDEMEIEDDPQTQEQLVREKLREVDELGDDQIENKIENYKSAGILHDEANDSKDILAKRQEQKQEQLIEQREKELEEQRKQRKQEQQKFKKTIQESDSLSGLQIPEDNKDEFQSYLFDPVDDEGHTQAEKDYQSMDREQVLTLYYLTYQGLDNLGDLIDNKATTKRAENLSDKLKKTSNRSVKDQSERSGQTRKSSDPNVGSFDLDQAIGS